MVGRWRSSVGVSLLFAVGAPITGFSLVVGSAALIALGPDAIGGNGVARFFLGLIAFCGYGLMLFTQLRYFNFLVFFGAFFALFLGVDSVHQAIDDLVLHQRGETTTCTVLQVHSRVVTSTSTDSNGNTSTTTTTYYDHRLDCADPRVQAMTTVGDEAADQGQQVDVVFDPASRLGTRPAAAVGDPRPEAAKGAVLIAFGILLRLLSELRVPLLRSRWDDFGPSWSSGPPRILRRQFQSFGLGVRRLSVALVQGLGAPPARLVHRVVSRLRNWRAERAVRRRGLVVAAGKVPADQTAVEDFLSWLARPAIRQTTTAALRGALRAVSDQEARDLVCTRAVEGDSEARAAALAADYLPTRDPDRAMLLFVTHRWDHYAELDPEGWLLAAGYASASLPAQARLREVARGSGHADLLRMLLGGDRKGRLRALVEAETSELVSDLIASDRQSEVWRLVRELPFRRGVAAAAALQASGWTPKAVRDRQVFRQLTGLAGDGRSTPSSLPALLCVSEIADAETNSWRSYTTPSSSLAPDGMTVAVVGDHEIKVWRCATGEVTRRIPVPRGNRVSVVNHGDRGLFVSNGATGGRSVTVYPSGPGDAPIPLDECPRRIVEMVASPDATVVTLEEDGGLSRWSAQGRLGTRHVIRPSETASPQSRFSAPLMAVSPDGDRVVIIESAVSYGSRHNLVVFRWSAGRALHSTCDDWVKAVAFTPDSQAILIASTRGGQRRDRSQISVRRVDWDLSADGELGGHVPAAGLIPIPRLNLIAVARDNALQLYGWPGRDLIAHVAVGPRIEGSLSATEDGSRLAASKNRAVLLWDTWPLVRPLADLTRADLTRVEAAIAGSSQRPAQPELTPLAALLRRQLGRAGGGTPPRSPATTPKPGM